MYPDGIQTTLSPPILYSFFTLKTLPVCCSQGNKLEEDSTVETSKRVYLTFSEISNISLPVKNKNGKILVSLSCINLPSQNVPQIALNLLPFLPPSKYF